MASVKQDFSFLILLWNEEGKRGSIAQEIGEMTKEYMKREDRTISENTVVVTSILLDEGEKARKSIKEHVT